MWRCHSAGMLLTNHGHWNLKTAHLFGEYFLDCRALPCSMSACPLPLPGRTDEVGFNWWLRLLELGAKQPYHGHRTSIEIDPTPTSTLDLKRRFACSPRPVGTASLRPPARSGSMFSTVRRHGVTSGLQRYWGFVGLPQAAQDTAFV